MVTGNLTPLEEGVSFTSSTVPETKGASSEPPISRVERRSRLSSMVAVNVTAENKVNFGIPSRQSMADFALEKHGEDDWRNKVHHFLGQKWLQLTLSGLLVSDVLIIFVELFLQAEYPSCRLIERDCEACCSGSGAERWLAGSGHDEVCEAGYEPIGVPGCDSYKWHTVHVIEEVLFYTTVGILSIFLVENLVEMAVLGVRKYFQQVFLALDFFVVTISLTMELTLHLMHSQLGQMVAILVIFRLWRFVRIGHGIMEVASELTHDQYLPLIDYVMDCEDKMRQAGIKIPEKTQKCKKLLEDGHH